MNLFAPLLIRALLAATAINGARAFGSFVPLNALSDSLWTYLTLGISTVLTEELAPIFGGFSSRQGELRLERVIIGITAGSWLATMVLYGAGMAKWEWMRRRFPKLRAAGTVALRVVQRNPWRASFLVRFAVGARLLLPMACGAARVRLPLYMTASLIGTVLWSAIFTMVGYAAGEAAMRVMGHVSRVGEILAVIAVTALVLLAVRWQRQRNARKERKLRRATRGGIPTPIATPTISEEGKV
jgi:membrane protein DedA with SNARE-associated domain